MLKQRVITAAVLLPLLLWGVFYGSNTLWIGLFGLFIALSTFEISQLIVPAFEKKLTEKEGSASSNGSSDGSVNFKGLKDETSFPGGRLPGWAIVSVFLAVSFFVVSAVADEAVAGQLASFSLILGMTYGVLTGGSVVSSMARVLGTGVSVMYGALPWYACYALFELAGDGRYLLLLIAVVMGSDTGAYFGGKSFGKRKLSPALSPNKTWEGLFSGVAVAVVFGVLANSFWDMKLGSVFFVALSSVFAAVFGVVGDLVESTFKRFSGTKDSGSIFPGHGGFMDRVDGIIFAAPVLWVCVSLFAK